MKAERHVLALQVVGLAALLLAPQSGCKSGDGGGAGGAAAGVSGGGAGGAAGGESGGAGGGGDGGGGGSPDGGADAAPTPSGATLVFVASNATRAITTLVLDQATGGLTSVGSVIAGQNPTYAAPSPDGRRLYAIRETGVNLSRVVGFDIDLATGTLSQINDARTEASNAPHLMVHKSGKWIVVPHYGTGHVTVVGVNPATGMLTDAAPQAVPTCVRAHQAVQDKSGSHVFVPCLGTNNVAQFTLNEQTGALVPATPPFVAAPPGAMGPRHMAFHPTEKWAYVVNELNGTLTQHDYNPATGLLAGGTVVSTVPEGIVETSSAHVEVHPTGRFLYASNRGHNSIAVFTLDEDTGAATRRDAVRLDIAQPRNFTIDPTGKWLLVANVTTNTIAVFGIDATTGALTRVGVTPVPASPMYVGAIVAGNGPGASR